MNGFKNLARMKLSVEGSPIKTGRTQSGLISSPMKISYLSPSKRDIILIYVLDGAATYSMWFSNLHPNLVLIPVLTLAKIVVPNLKLW